MFHYLHSYMPETWEAQVKCGLVNENAGIRYSQSIDIPEELKFNNLAAKGGALYELARDEGLSQQLLEEISALCDSFRESPALSSFYPPLRFPRKSVVRLSITASVKNCTPMC